MGAASIRNATRRVLRALVPLCLTAAAAGLPACQPAMPLEPAARAAPRHPIQSPDWGVRSPSEPVATSSGDDRGRITPGPNSRVSPTPDMAPRVEPADRPTAPSSQRDIDELRRDLQQQRRYQPREPGPPAGTIDRRPGTIRTNPGTIEIPR